MWKDKIREDLKKNQEFQDNLKEVLDNKAIQKGVEVTEKIKEGKDKGVNVVMKGAEKVFDVADIVAENQVSKKVVETIDKIQESEIVKDYTIDKMKEYSFRSEFKREQDKEKGLEYNPYLDKILDENTIEKSESTEIVIIKDESYKNKLEKVSEFLGESKNPLIKGINKIIGGITNIVGYVESSEIIKPSEKQLVLTKLKESDPLFNLDHFLIQSTKIINLILNSYSKGDIITLKNYCSIKCFNSYLYPRLQQYKLQELFLHSKILDIGELTILNVTFLNEKPCIVLGGTYQFTHCLKDKKDNIVEGSIDKIHTESHLWVFTYTLESKDWEIEELSFGGNIRV